MARGSGKSIERKLKPEEGWWKSYTGAVVREVAQQMIDSGIDPADVEAMIGRLHSAFSSEFGN